MRFSRRRACKYLSSGHSCEVTKENRKKKQPRHEVILWAWPNTIRINSNTALLYSPSKTHIIRHKNTIKTKKRRKTAKNAFGNSVCFTMDTAFRFLFHETKWEVKYDAQAIIWSPLMFLSGNEMRMRFIGLFNIPLRPEHVIRATNHQPSKKPHICTNQFRPRALKHVDDNYQFQRQNQN